MIAVSTLFDIIVRLKGGPLLAPARRRDLISAVLRICEITGVDPRITPASLSFMRPLLKKVRPAKHGLSPKTWSNLRSNFRAALVHALPRPPRKPHPEWERLRGTLPNTRMSKGLSRFIGFCEREEIPPAAVSDEIIERFLAHLEADTGVWSPRDCHRRTCCLWNKAIESVAGWPHCRVTLPGYRRQRQSRPIGSYPPETQKDYASYLASLGRVDLFANAGPRRALRQSTVRQRGSEIELALSAVVESGRDPASITSLACLVEPDVFRTVLLRYLKDDGTPRPFAHNIAWTLIGLAIRWVKPAPAVLDELRDLQRRLGPYRKGLTEKNKTVLRELDDLQVRARFLFLPERLTVWAERSTPARGARMIKLAVAIAILQSAPLRISNLAGLRLDRHMVRPGGPRSLWQIEIPAHEVKNNQALVHELPRRVTTFVDRFIRRYRPTLATPGNPYLFPVGSGSADAHTLSQQIRSVLADWVGIDMTPHQFRHFAARLMQQHSPGAFTAIAQLLGHKDVQTAIAYYAELDTLSAGRQFDEILEAERGKTRPPGPRRS